MSCIILRSQNSNQHKLFSRRTSQKVKRDENAESAKEKEKEEKKDNNWLKKPGKPIIKK